MRAPDKRTPTERLLDGETIDLSRLPGASENGLYRVPVRLNRQGQVELTSGFGLRSEEVRVLQSQMTRDIADALARPRNGR